MPRSLEVCVFSFLGLKSWGLPFGIASDICHPRDMQRPSCSRIPQEQASANLRPFYHFSGPTIEALGWTVVCPHFSLISLKFLLDFSRDVPNALTGQFMAVYKHDPCVLMSFVFKYFVGVLFLFKSRYHTTWWQLTLIQWRVCHLTQVNPSVPCAQLATRMSNQHLCYPGTKALQRM